jgi:hypothetical protein
MEANKTVASRGPLFRGLLVAFAIAVGEGVSEMVAKGNISGAGLVTTFLGAVALTWVFAWLSTSLRWPFSQRFIALAVAIFVIAKLNTGLELFFFSTQSTAKLVTYELIGLAKSVLYAWLIAYFFHPSDEDASIKSDLQRLFVSRGIVSWILRLSVADIVYVLTYFVFGAVAFKFTRPYYTDPSYGLNLKLPAVGLVFKLQFLRSLIYIIVTLPLIAGLRLRKPTMAVLIGLVLFVAGGLTPLLANQEWPAALRFYHGVEILSQNFTTGFLFVYLLAASRLSEEHSIAQGYRAPA